MTCSQESLSQSTNFVTVGHGLVDPKDRCVENFENRSAQRFMWTVVYHLKKLKCFRHAREIGVFQPEVGALARWTRAVVPCVSVSFPVVNSSLCDLHHDSSLFGSSKRVYHLMVVAELVCPCTVSEEVLWSLPWQL